MNLDDFIKDDMVGFLERMAASKKKRSGAEAAEISALLGASQNIQSSKKSKQESMKPTVENVTNKTVTNIVQQAPASNTTGSQQSQSPQQQATSTSQAPSSTQSFQSSQSAQAAESPSSEQSEQSDRSTHASSSDGTTTSGETLPEKESQDTGVPQQSHRARTNASRTDASTEQDTKRGVRKPQQAQESHQSQQSQRSQPHAEQKDTRAGDYSHAESARPSSYSKPSGTTSTGQGVSKRTTSAKGSQAMDRKQEGGTGEVTGRGSVKGSSQEDAATQKKGGYKEVSGTESSRTRTRPPRSVFMMKHDVEHMKKLLKKREYAQALHIYQDVRQDFEENQDEGIFKEEVRQGLKEVSEVLRKKIVTRDDVKNFLGEEVPVTDNETQEQKKGQAEVDDSDSAESERESVTDTEYEEALGALERRDKKRALELLIKLARRYPQNSRIREKLRQALKMQD